jgi:uncharacterized protein YgbK (DUF1537 family)
VTAFAAIADDLTGACDVAAELAEAGQRVCVVVEPGSASDSDAGIAIVNTQSRSLAPAAAAARVGEALRGRVAPIVLKKIDTALRGHLGAELEVACRVLAAPAFVLAAIPAAGRTTRNGCQWFGDRLLADTEFARDPEGPGAMSSIPEVLARESSVPSAIVGRDLIRAGGLAAEVARRRRDGTEIFVVDAESDDDVRAAVAAILALPRPLCLAGSIALTAALAPYLEAPADLGRDVTGGALPLPALIVSGSLHSRARAQVDAVLTARLAVALPMPASVGETGALDVLVRAAVRALAAGTNVVLAANPPSTVPSEEALRATEQVLAEAVAAIAGGIALATLVLIGGETSHAILVRLGAGEIQVQGRIAPLIARGIIRRGLAAGTRLVTKGGSGGDPDVIAVALAAGIRGQVAEEERA